LEACEGKKMTSLFQRMQIAVVLLLVTSLVSGLPISVHAADVDPGSMTREQWREHVRATKRRVQEEATQRRLEQTRALVEISSEDEARRRSEVVLSDDSLVPGDIVMTDKGMFVFKGRNSDEINDRNFEPVRGRK
jgi:hypothetical protein